MVEWTDEPFARWSWSSAQSGSSSRDPASRRPNRRPRARAGPRRRAASGSGGSTGGSAAMSTTPHRRGTRTRAMETNRTVTERELAKLNEVRARDARRTHHRLGELLTIAMAGDARRTDGRGVVARWCRSNGSGRSTGSVRPATCDRTDHPAAADPSGPATIGTASNLPTVRPRPLSILSHSSGGSRDGRLGGVPDVTDQAQ
jgi:hypothetical protein